MTLAHVKAHWVKYYLGVGAVWTAYNLYTYASTRNAMGVTKSLLLWPLDVYQTLSGQTSTTGTASTNASQSTVASSS